MIEPQVVDRLMAEARSVLREHFRTRSEADGVVVDLTREDGTVLWPNYGIGPELLAVLAAEQRYLVEQEGRDAVAGATYLDKARERVRRALRPDNP